MSSSDDPILIGPFAVSRDGSLGPREDDFVCAFSWISGAHRIRCRIEGGRIIMRAVLCRVPSTAESTPPDEGIRLREAVFAAVATARARLPKGWRLGLLPDHGIAIEASADLPKGTTGTGLIAENVAFAMRLAPYLEFFSETGACAPTSSHAAA